MARAARTPGAPGGCGRLPRCASLAESQLQLASARLGFASQAPGAICDPFRIHHTSTTVLITLIIGNAVFEKLRSKAAGTSRNRSEEKEGDPDSHRRDGLWDVALRPDREHPSDGNLRVRERPGTGVRRAKRPRGKKDPVPRPGSRMRRCTRWRGGGSPSILGPRSGPGRARP